jgi:hypothetical protein
MTINITTKKEIPVFNNIDDTLGEPIPINEVLAEKVDKIRENFDERFSNIKPKKNNDENDYDYDLKNCRPIIKHKKNI